MSTARDDEAVHPHTRDNPCPVCGGYDSLQRHAGARCHGFTSADERWAFCTREEYASGLDPTGSNADLYRHALFGTCHCGTAHAGAGPQHEGPTSYTYTGPRYDVHETRYDITLMSGEVLATHVRTDFKHADGTPDKVFRWEFNGNRGLQGIKARELPLYGLPGLRQVPHGSLVYLTEGEKARDELHRRGLPALGTVTGKGTIPCDARLAVCCDYRIALWPDADADQGGQKSMERIAGSLQRIGLGADAILWVDWPGTQDGDDAYDFFAQGGTVKQLEALVIPAPVGPNRKDAFRPLSVAEQDALPPPSWVVDGLLQSPALAVVFGAAASFKTTGVVGLCCAIASGRPEWLGLPIRASGPVLYLAGEDPSGVAARRRAWEQRYTSGAAVAAFSLVQTVPRLAEPTDVDVCCAAVEETERRYALIVLDTLTEALVGRGQDKVEDMSLALTAARRLAAYCDVVLIIHHTGWASEAASRPRGSSTLGQVAETLVLFEGDGASVTVTVTKQKNGPSNRHCDLIAEVVAVPTPADPEATSVVLAGSALSLLDDPTTVAAPVRQARGRKPARQSSELLDSLVDGMTRAEWFHACELPKSTFDHHRRQLVGGHVRRVVKRADGRYYHIPADEQTVDLDGL